MWRGDEIPASDRPIALLVNILSGGGAQRRVASLANRFAELGRTVELVSYEADGPMRAILSPAVRVAPIEAGGLAAYCEQARPAVLMSCVTDTHRAAVAAARDTSVPLVLRASRHPYRKLPRWNLPKRLAEPFKLRRTARLYAQADAIVALSDDGADALRRLLGRRPARIETIPNPVVDRIRAAPRGPCANMPLVLGVGRLTAQKDFTTLLRAFALVRADRPARLHLLGEGPERRRLRALATRLGIARDVEMPGEVRDVADRLLHADLLVSSSLWEGMQAVPIEALAAGCPVVATDCPGGARETLQDGRLGPLVPVRDPAAMARAMIATLDAPPDPALLAEGAARFTAEGKAELYLALFDALAGARAGSPAIPAGAMSASPPAPLSSQG
ncbi:glycosyltransferase [Sphingomonas chungangi]|nr:glycosyltransferase [Sphingomonas chungangi]